MKKIIYAALIAATTLFASCTDEGDDLAVISANPSEPAMQIPEDGDIFVLTDDAANNKITFKWKSADYGIPTEITYKLQIDVDGGDFSDPIEIGETTNNYFSIKTEALNNKLYAKFETEDQLNLQVRISATVSKKYEALNTTPIEIMYKLYKAEIKFPKLCLAGSHQGWDPASTTTLIYSVKSDGKYKGYINLDNGDDSNVEYKFTDGLGWDVQWGDSGTENMLAVKGGNILLIDPGFYFVKVNTNDLSYSLEKQSWGILGNATPTDWGSDTDLSFDVEANALVVTIDLIPGEFIFRLNDDWATKIGALEGKLAFGGKNIKFDGEAGTYKVTLNLSAPTFKYSIEKL